MKGLVKSFQVNSVSIKSRPIFRLPVGYRPESRRLFPSNGRASTENVDVASGRIDVAPDGLVTMLSDCSDSFHECSADGAWLTLDGITFRPDE